MKSYRDITQRYLKKQIKRTILTITGIILAVSLITAIGTLGVSQQKMAIRDTIKETGDFHAIFTDVNGDNVSKIKNNVDIVNAAITTREADAALIEITEKEKKLIKNVPPYRYLRITDYDANAIKSIPIVLKEGRLPRAENELILDYTTMDYLKGKYRVGDKIRLNFGIRKYTNGDQIIGDAWSQEEIFEKTGEREFTIVGLIKTSIFNTSSYFFNGITFFNNNNLVSNKKYDVYTKMISVKRAKDIAEALSGKINLPKIKGNDGALSYPIKYNDQLLSLSLKGMNGSDGLYLILAILVTVISTIAIIYNAFNISVTERISQLGILRCAGATPGQIRRIVMKEAGIMSLFGIPLGLLCGILLVKILVFIMNAATSNTLADFSMTISEPVLLVSGILGITTVYISAFSPSLKAARISPMDAIRNAGSVNKEDLKKVRKHKFISRIFNAEGQIAFKNLGRNKSRLKITVFSMIISIALFIGFGSLTDSLSKVNQIWRSEFADKDFRLNGEGINIASKYNDIKKIAGVDGVYRLFQYGVTAVVPRNLTDSRFMQLRKDRNISWNDNETLLPGMIVSYGDDEFPELRKNLIAGTVDKSIIDKENGVILMAQNRLTDENNKRYVIVNAVKYKIGDKINILISDGYKNLKAAPKKTVKIIGILNKGIFEYKYNTYDKLYHEQICLYTTDNVYKKITGNEYSCILNIKLKENADSEPVRNYLKGINAKDPRYSYEDLSENAKNSMNNINALKIMLFSFIGLITLIGSLNIMNTISVNLILRTRELSVLRSIGMTRNGIKKLVYFEGVLYGVISAIYGSIIGIGLSYILFKVFINIVAKEMEMKFVWSLPFKHVLIAAAGGILLTLLSAYLPLRRINRGAIIDNIRMPE